MKFNEDQESRIVLIMEERGCTRGNAVRVFRKELAKGVETVLEHGTLVEIPVAPELPTEVGVADLLPPTDAHDTDESGSSEGQALQEALPDEPIVESPEITNVPLAIRMLHNTRKQNGMPGKIERMALAKAQGKTEKALYLELCAQYGVTPAGSAVKVKAPIEQPAS